MSECPYVVVVEVLEELVVVVVLEELVVVEVFEVVVVVVVVADAVMLGPLLVVLDIIDDESFEVHVLLEFTYSPLRRQPEMLTRAAGQVIFCHVTFGLSAPRNQSKGKGDISFGPCSGNL